MTERITHIPSDETGSRLEEPERNKASIDMDAQPLYPSVQRSMDDLKRIIDERAQDNPVRYTPSGEPIINGDILETWAKGEGYGNGKRGTYHNEDTYVYIKHCNLVPKEEDVDKTLATARHLTSLGAIHPESQWGVFDTEQYGYQLFVVSPKLEPWSLEEAYEGTYDDRSSRPTNDHSHLLDWFKRIDPTFTPGQPIPENSLLHHLNWTEASHPDNWGWDDTGTLFPVDVEVLRPQEPGYKDYEPWKPKEYTSTFDDIF